MPKMLTDYHKTERMGSVLKFLKHYVQVGDEFLNSIVTEDETWGFSPHSWIQATVTAMAPYAFPQNQKIQNLNLSEKNQKRHSPGQLHASWHNN